MRIGLQPGVWTTALGLAGAGAIMIAPDQMWIGYGLLAAAAGVFLWGIRINGRHWWQRKKASVAIVLGAPEKRIPLRDLVRRVALHTEWGLSYQPSHWPLWQDVLKQEILHKLVEGGVPARGIRNLPGQPEDSAPTRIKSDFWAAADFHPEHMLVDNESGMMWQKGEPCPLLYHDIQFSSDAVDRVWPAVPKRRRKGRVSAFAQLAREWHEEQEDARINRNPGVGFAIGWEEAAKRESLARAAKDQGEKPYRDELARQQAAIKAKADMMRQRLHSRNHSVPGALNTQLAAWWDAEQRGDVYDAVHKITLTPISRLVEDGKRRALITKGRDVVHRWRTSNRSQPFEVFASQDRDYLDVQPHLGDEYQAERRRAADRIIYGPEHDELRVAALLQELARLENEWEL